MAIKAGSSYYVKTNEGVMLFYFIQELTNDLSREKIKGKVEVEIILEGGSKIKFNLNLKKRK